MHRTSLTHILPYAPDQLFELVGDVERYPEFVPWVARLRTWNAARPAEGVTQVDAEAEVRFAMLKEKFATRVVRDSRSREIDVSLLYGPFKRLRNHWRFTPEGAGTKVDFDIEFEFKSRMLDMLLAANLKTAADRIMRCFEDRARQLHDAAPAA